MLEATACIIAYTHNNKDRAVLKHHADMIWSNCQEQVSSESDRNSIEQRYKAVEKARLKPTVINLTVH